MGDEIVVVKITRREAIKPYSPTTQHLKTLKLSRPDQLSLDIYVPVILFYPCITPQKQFEIAYEQIQRLGETLSKFLDLYYPFAGRLKNNHLIECIDEGVEFIEAKSPVLMSEIFKYPNRTLLINFIAAQPESRLESHGGSILLVQATIFSCGGIALGLSFSHKLADACTVCGFVKSWARISLYENNPELLLLEKPEFGQARDIFPPINPQSSILEQFSNIEHVQRKLVTRRYVFTAEKIATLKSILQNNPTRIEAVSSLLLNSAIKASASKSSALLMAMNVRKRIIPPLGDNVVGSLSSTFSAKIDHDQEVVVGLQVIVDKLRKGIEEAAKSYSGKENILKAVEGHFEEGYRLIKSDESELFLCSSWCRLGLYEANFGWEKPAWVSTVLCSDFKCFISLMDTKDGDGIEAWFVLKEDDVAFIETNQDMLAFASFNPSVV